MRVLGPWTSVLGCPGLGQFPCRVVIILMTVRRSWNAPYNLRLVKLDVHVCGTRKYARICWRTYLYGRPTKQKACVWAHEAFKMKRWDSQRPAFLGNAAARIPPRNMKMRFDSCQVQMNLFRTVNCRSPRASNFISIKSHQTIALIEDKQTDRSLGYPVPSVSRRFEPCLLTHIISG